MSDFVVKRSHFGRMVKSFRDVADAVIEGREFPALVQDDLGSDTDYRDGYAKACRDLADVLEALMKGEDDGPPPG